MFRYPVVWLVVVVFLLLAAPSAGAGATLAPATPHVQTATWSCWHEQIPGWCHGLPLKVAMSPAGDGWILGQRGMALHWAGGPNWARVPTPVDADLVDASVLSSGDAWAIDLGGDILHWDGKTWRSDPVLPGDLWSSLFNIAMASPTDGWATGQIVLPGPAESMFLRWNGQTWSRFGAIPGGYARTFSLAMAGANDGWAVVGSGVAGQGDLLHWDGQAWSKWPLDGSPSLRGLSVIAAGDVWAAGEGGVVLHWDGQAWRAIQSHVTEPLLGIAMRTPADGWAWGNASVYHWNGSDWTAVPYPSVGRVTGVAAAAAGDAWLIGDTFVMRRTGSGWQVYGSAPLYDLKAVSMAGADEGWAVGTAGKALHWQGAAWADVSTGVTETLTAVATVSANDAWAAGAAGKALHWNGALWQPVPVTTTYPLKTIAMASSGEGWASDGSAILRWDGHAWQGVPAPGNSGVVAISVLAPDDVWMVGPGANILRWDGQKLAAAAGSGFYATSIAMLSDGDGWIAGWTPPFFPHDRARGIAQRWNGQAWLSVPLPGSTFRLDALGARAPDDVWLAGRAYYASGSVLNRWNGAQISRLSPAAEQAAPLLNAISFGSPNDGWVVGDRATLMRYRPLGQGLYLPLTAR